MIEKLFQDLRKDKKKRDAALAIVVAVLVVLYFQFLLRPQLSALGARMGKFGKIGSELSTAKDDIARMPQMKKVVAAYQSKIGRYEKVLPTEEGIPSLLEYLSEMARRSHVRIVGIVPGSRNKIQRDQTYHEIPIMVTARSGYHQLGAFLQEIENSDRFMKISDIKIRSNAATLNKHDVDMLVLTYILLENK